MLLLLRVPLGAPAALSGSSGRPRPSVLLLDAILHQRPQVGILHGGRYSLLVVDLFVNWDTTDNTQRKSLLCDAAPTHTHCAILTLVLGGMRAFLDVDVQLQLVRNAAFDLDANAQSDKCGQRAMRHGRIEFNANLYV